MKTMRKTDGLLILFFSCLITTVIAQKVDSAARQKEENRVRADTVNINLKNISTQLVTLRDSLGVEIMALDKKMINLQPTAKLNIEKIKCRLSVYKAELEKLIEEITVADISYITDVKKRAYHTVLDVRADFTRLLAETKEVN